eukprot:3939673-Rhodomonas_salina.2
MLALLRETNCTSLESAEALLSVSGQVGACDGTRVDSGLLLALLTPEKLISENHELGVRSYLLQAETDASPLVASVGPVSEYATSGLPPPNPLLAVGDSPTYSRFGRFLWFERLHGGVLWKGFIYGTDRRVLENAVY